MSLDLIGPASAVGAALARPVETREFGSVDTWFVPCTSQSSRDGTQIQAVFLNGILGQIRYALRASGIPLDNLDDSMLWQAMQAANAGIPYGVASGTGAVLTVVETVPRIQVPYREGEIAAVAMPGDLAIATNATIAFGAGAETGDRLALTRNDGSPIQSGDGPGGSTKLVVYRQGKWRLMTPGEAEFPRILGTATIYVDRTEGNDNNDARSPATALQTLEAALDKARGYYLLGRQLLIQLVRGGEHPFPPDYPELSGSLAIRGSLSAQSSYILTGSGATGAGRGGVIEADGFRLSLQGLTVRNTSTDRFTVASSEGGHVSLTNVTLTSTATLSSFHLYATGGSTAQINVGTRFASSAAGMMSCRKGEIGISSGAALFVDNSPTWSVAAAVPVDFGTINARSGVTITGAATGKRFEIASPAIIRASGAGLNLFPGSVDGTITDTAGRYFQ